MLKYKFSKIYRCCVAQFTWSQLGKNGQISCTKSNHSKLFCSQANTPPQIATCQATRIHHQPQETTLHYPFHHTSTTSSHEILIEKPSSKECTTFRRGFLSIGLSIGFGMEFIPDCCKDDGTCQENVVH